MSWLSGINFNCIEQTRYIENFIEENKVSVYSRLPAAFVEIVANAPEHSFLDTLESLESQRIYLCPKNHQILQSKLEYNIPNIDRLSYANSYSSLLEIPSRWGVLSTLRQIRAEEMIRKNNDIPTIYKELGISLRTVKNLSKKLSN